MIPDIEIGYRLDDRSETVRFRDVPLQAWRDIKAETGLTPKTVADGLSDMDVDAVLALVYASRRSNRKRDSFRQVIAELDEVDEFVPTKVTVEGDVYFDADDDADDEDEVPPTSDS